MPWAPRFASSGSNGFGKPAQSPYQRPFSTTPPSARAEGSATPFFAQTVHDTPLTEPEASSIDALVNFAAGCPDDAGVDLGLQLEESAEPPPPEPPRPKPPIVHCPWPEPHEPSLPVICTSRPGWQVPKPTWCMELSAAVRAWVSISL